MESSFWIKSRPDGGGSRCLKSEMLRTHLPGSNLATLETTNTYHGVTQRHAYRRVYDDRIDLTFYVDAETILQLDFLKPGLMV